VQSIKTTRRQDSWRSLVAAKPMSTTILSYAEQAENLIVQIAYTCTLEHLKTTLNSLYVHIVKGSQEKCSLF